MERFPKEVEMANYGEGGERAWWEVLNPGKEVIGEHIKGFEEQEVEEHGANCQRKLWV